MAKAQGAIALPNGGGALRAIGETFTPSLQTGTAELTVPIELPAGRNGFHPSLALAYSSGHGIGPFGLGWSLAVPGVRRKTSAGVPRYQHDDVFVLSGAEDLVPVPGAGAGRQRYRPRVEGVFARIDHVVERGGDYWEVCGRDGHRSIYGSPRPAGAASDWRDPASISDPAAAGRVFAWLLSETVDPFGNRIEYEYERDTDGASFTQLYLSRVRYVDFDRPDGTTGFLVEACFDYDQLDGELLGGGGFRDGRAGFEIRTRRRCRQISVWINADQRRLLRTTELQYADSASAPGSAPANGTWLLTSVTVRGHDGDAVEALPPLVFDYSRFEPQERKYQQLTGRAPDLPAESLAQPGTELVDLSGFGLPSVLSMNGSCRYWRNLGDGHLDLGTEMRAAPSQGQLGQAGVQLADADGDGRPDLIVTQPPLAGYWPLTAEGEFDTDGFVRYPDAPSVGLSDPEVRLVDLDGDGITDILQNLDSAFVLYFNDGDAGWRSQRVGRGEVPILSFADPRVKLADMTGDGLTDIVLVHDGCVEYWPARGWGRWGAKVTMRQAPYFRDPAYGSLRFDPRRLLIGDVDGDGCADLVYVGAGRTTIWLNCGGISWSDPSVIHGTPPVAELDAVRLADMLGGGTGGVLWSYDRGSVPGSNYKYLDLTGGTKPYLLTRIDNNRGAVTEIQYTTSTRFYLDDQAQGRPWQTTLPFPVHVVARVTVDDVFSETRLTSEFRYHHGHWDGAEREFRGFACVEQNDALTSTDPSPSEAEVSANMLHNPSFDTPGPGPTSLSGAKQGGPSAAAGWNVWNNSDTVTTTELRPSTLPGTAGSMIRVTTGGPDCGLYQPFLPYNTGSDQAVSAVWVHVVRGSVFLGTGNGGNTSADVTCTETGRWVRIEAPNGHAPANELIIYGADPAGSEFYVDAACTTLPRPRHMRPVRTVTWFHVGPVGRRDNFDELDLFGEFWAGDPNLLAPRQTASALTKGVPRGVRRDALRALHGRMLRSETYSDDGSQYQKRPYTVTEASPALHAILDTSTGTQLIADSAALPAGWGLDTPAVFFPHSDSQRVTQWERGEDPMSSVEFIAGWDTYGRARHHTKIAPPRRSQYRTPICGAVRGTVLADTTTILATHTVTDYAAPSTAASYMHDRVAQEHTFEVDAGELTETAPGDLRVVLRDQAAAAARIHLGVLDQLKNWTPGTSPPAGAIPLRVIGHTLHHYDGPAFAGLDVGNVERGALTRTEILTDLTNPQSIPFAVDWTALGYRIIQTNTPPYQPGGIYADTARITHDFQATGPPPHAFAAWPQRGLVIATQDALGNPPTTVTPDAYWLLTEFSRDPVGLETTAVYDYRCLQPISVTDPNGNTTHMRYSPLGLPAASWTQSRPTAAGGCDGGTAAVPDITYTYDLDPYRTRGQPVSVHIARRVWHASQNQGDDAIESRDYSDGFGRLLQSRRQADLVVYGPTGDNVGLPAGAGQDPQAARGTHDPERVVVSGWQTYDNKGRVIEKNEPFFASGWDFQADVAAGVRAELFYDPRGQLIRTLNPDGSEQRVIYGQPRTPTALVLIPDDVAPVPTGFDPTPWSSYIYDANDLAAVTTSTDGTALVSRADSSHYNTPTSSLLDALGRVICQVHRFATTSDAWLVTTHAYDMRGNRTLTLDPYGRPAQTSFYDLLNRAVRTRTLDAGERTNVLDAVGNAAQTRDAKGATATTSYDPANRPVTITANDHQGAPTTVRQRIIYGDGGSATQPQADRDANKAANRLGSPAEHFDEAGHVTFDAYDFKGNLTTTARAVIADEVLAAVPFDQDFTPDWSRPGTQLDATVYQTNTTYDALNRTVTITTPADANGHRHDLHHTYTRSGSPDTITLDSEPYVLHTAYNAKGQIVLIAYGDALMTRYSYDPATFRLSRLRTDPYTHDLANLTWITTGPPLQDYSYTTDLVGNITQIDERIAGCGVTNNPQAQDPTATGGDPDLARLLATGGALIRRFTYDALYRLTTATGRALKLPRSLADTPGWGSYQPGPPAPTPENAPDLTEPYTEAYHYDGAGNLTQLAYSGGPGRGWNRNYGHAGLEPGSSSIPSTNQLTSLRIGQDTHTYQHDQAGNLTQQNTERHHAWDYADRMIGYRNQNGAIPSLHARYLYAADGTRVKKWVRRNNASGSDTSTTYIGALYEHTVRAASAPATFVDVHHASQRVALARQGTPDPDDQGPGIAYHHGDHLGSSTLLVDCDTRQLRREEYFPYGETSYGGYTRKRYRYTGKERDEETGLHYHGARYYAPWLARWASCDPSGLADGANVYAYVSANPMRLADPVGRAGEPPLPANYPKQFEFVEGPAYEMPATATEAGRGFTKAHYEERDRRVQAWGAPGKYDLGHPKDKPFALQKVGETVRVRLQREEANRREGALIRPLIDAARKGGVPVRDPYTHRFPSGSQTSPTGAAKPALAPSGQPTQLELPFGYGKTPASSLAKPTAPPEDKKPNDPPGGASGGGSTPTTSTTSSPKSGGGASGGDSARAITVVGGRMFGPQGEDMSARYVIPELGDHYAVSNEGMAELGRGMRKVWNSVSDKVAAVTGLSGLALTVAVAVYFGISEGSRFAFPPRNWVPAW